MQLVPRAACPARHGKMATGRRSSLPGRSGSNGSSVPRPRLNPSVILRRKRAIQSFCAAFKGFGTYSIRPMKAGGRLPLGSSHPLLETEVPQHATEVVPLPSSFWTLTTYRCAGKF